MAIGKNIRQLRTNKNLTQKELAEKLNVTYQAVSRWEKDEVEPSIDTLKQMTIVFECSLDEIFGTKPIEKPEPTVVEKVIIKEAEPKVVEKVIIKESEPKVIEKVVEKEQKPVLGVCEICNKPIFEADDLNRVDVPVTVKNGRASHTEIKTKVLCSNCNNQRIEDEKKETEKKQEEKQKDFKLVRKKSFIISSIISAIFIIISIILFASGNVSAGIYLIITSIFAFTFSSCMILDNTFLSELWVNLATLGIKLPGVIFEFSIDGLIFLITVKIIFWAIGILVSILSFTFATLLGALLSIFVYPLALTRNLKFIEYED